MAACSSLRPLFENPLPENPSLIESLSTWNQINKTMKPIDGSSFTEIFGELHFKEKPEPVASNPFHPTTSPPALDQSPQCDNRDTREPKGRKDHNPSLDSSLRDQCMGNPKGNDCFPSLDSLFGAPKDQYKAAPRSNDGFSPKNLESSLQLCTEGLGSESSDVDVEDSRNGSSRDWSIQGNEVSSGVAKRSAGSPNEYSRNCSHVRSKSDGAFPPPISCIGSSGKPWVWFRSYREDGRFVLREIRIPTQECLHASREDGRLKLHFVQQDGDIEEGKEEEAGEEEEREEICED